LLLEQFYSNDKAKKTLVNFLTDGRFPHTILLEGEDGCGKLTFAHMIAAALLCEQPLEQRPCGQCRNCKRVLSDTHPDVSVIGNEDKLKGFHIDRVRQLRADAYIRPNEGGYKVYILRNIHNMTEQAQNALLKIIEEPPAQVVFLLTCNNRARVLPTILSRAAVLPLSVCSVQECETALHTLEPQMTAERIAQAARLAHGNIGKARMILQDEGSLKLACDAQRIAQMVCVGQEFELLCSLQEYTNNKQRTNFLLLMQEARRCMVDWIRQQHGLVSEEEQLPPTVKNRFSTLQAMQILDIIDTAVAQASQNVSLSLVAAAFCAAVKMKRQ